MENNFVNFKYDMVYGSRGGTDAEKGTNVYETSYFERFLVQNALLWWFGGLVC